MDISTLASKKFWELTHYDFQILWQYISKHAKLFLKSKGGKKFMFRCHTLTHGTDLRRLPLGMCKSVFSWPPLKKVNKLELRNPVCQTKPDGEMPKGTKMPPDPDDPWSTEEEPIDPQMMDPLIYRWWILDPLMMDPLIYRWWTPSSTHDGTLDPQMMDPLIHRWWILDPLMVDPLIYRWWTPSSTHDGTL